MSDYLVEDNCGKMERISNRTCILTYIWMDGIWRWMKRIDLMLTRGVLLQKENYWYDLYWSFSTKWDYFEGEIIRICWAAGTVARFILKCLRIFGVYTLGCLKLFVTSRCSCNLVGFIYFVSYTTKYWRHTRRIEYVLSLKYQQMKHHFQNNLFLSINH